MNLMGSVDACYRQEAGWTRWLSDHTQLISQTKPRSALFCSHRGQTVLQSSSGWPQCVHATNFDMALSPRVLWELLHKPSQNGI